MKEACSPHHPHSSPTAHLLLSLSPSIISCYVPLLPSLDPAQLHKAPQRSGTSVAPHASSPTPRRLVSLSYSHSPFSLQVSFPLPMPDLSHTHSYCLTVFSYTHICTLHSPVPLFFLSSLSYVDPCSSLSSGE